jgi:hypothetical protein
MAVVIRFTPGGGSSLVAAAEEALQRDIVGSPVPMARESSISEQPSGVTPRMMSSRPNPYSGIPGIGGSTGVNLPQPCVCTVFMSFVS